MFTLLRRSRPLSDHGKCATGMTKKLLLESAIPARALYQAKNAARIPKAPPALMAEIRGAPSTRARYPIPRQRNARSRVKKREKKATVDLTVQMSNKKVKMNQPNIKNPKESRNRGLVGPPRDETILKPPGVRTIAKEIQKPP